MHPLLYCNRVGYITYIHTYIRIDIHTHIQRYVCKYALVHACFDTYFF